MEKDDFYLRELVSPFVAEQIADLSLLAQCSFPGAWALLARRIVEGRLSRQSV
jgi:hypothetical protein